MEGPPSNHHSPTQTYNRPYPPAEIHARHRSNSYTALPQSPGSYQNHPNSPSHTRLPPPPSPVTRDRPASGYYDPTSEARSNRDASGSVNGMPYQARSPIQGRTHADHYSAHPGGVQPVNGHIDARIDPGRRPSYTSPQLGSHALPGPPIISNEQRPPSSAHDHPVTTPSHSHTRSNDSIIMSTPVAASAPSAPAPPRSTNPMSMMNILSEAPPAEQTPAPQPPPPPAVAQASIDPPVVTTPAATVKKSTSTSTPKSSSRKTARSTARSHQSIKVKQEDASEHPRGAVATIESRPAAKSSSRQQPAAIPAPIGPPGLNAAEVEAAYKEIEARELSDVESDAEAFAAGKQDYKSRTLQRALQNELEESDRRKRRRISTMQKYHDIFNAAAEAERQIFIDRHENEVAEEVRLKEIEEDKERKKDQQRKRRREKAIIDEQQKREENLQSLANIKDEDEKARIEREIQRSEKKIRDTQNRLQGIIPVKESRTEAPAASKRDRDTDQNGTTQDSQAGNEDGAGEATSGRSRGRGGRTATGGRARKSKEQKQAEKDNAKLGQSMLDQGQEIAPLDSKEEDRLSSLADRKTREDSEAASDATPAAFDGPTSGLTGMAKFESKGYNQIYEQISRDIAKSVPKVYRIKNNSLDTKQSNARKTAQLAAKEARRWQMRTNKSTKDVAARAKRAMREMLGFWKRNERDEREGRKAAERQELDKARRMEAEREAARQKRKLNFLISQTELYSHFIGKKVKTDEIEKHGDGDGVRTSGQTVTSNPNATHTIDLPDSVADPSQKVTNLDELDFDAEDETALRKAAATNAQIAIQEAQDRARAFNKPDELSDAQASFDDGEMNFQNPTSLQTMDVTQPKLLQCQLKEYQLKGLNWLVNLYEQGINGILADEMGLGKTVQSISVMAYLAEVHNIWGPFLVIAPASTLHNWQQEITKFVPDIKVLPYWGSAKDRKVLRKFWDRKHITYTRDSPFHVLVTSYQLVVLDTAYFQKVKWQYMILDEAQAIKSSQSSRWKSLLGFHCRNRLLLTGTPIQNNMQELWALLHFIMPSLFDSHDEFSEWFSKDIENHAQSNTKLNEDQLRRLHMILKPFMLRRIKKHVQKELGDKIEEDVFCDLTYRQRAYYTNLRNKISIMDLIEKAAGGDDQDAATLMNLVMQFRKVCNHPDLFERAEVWSPMSMSSYAETASFMREGYFVNVSYSVRSLIECWLPSMIGGGPGRLDIAGPDNEQAGWRKKWLYNDLNIWQAKNIQDSQSHNAAFSWLRFVGQSAGDVAITAKQSLLDRIISLAKDKDNAGVLKVAYDDNEEKENAGFTPVHDMLNIVKRNSRRALAEVTNEGHLHSLFNISRQGIEEQGYGVIERAYLPPASAPPIELVCRSYQSFLEQEKSFFSVPLRRALYPISAATESALMQAKLPLSKYPVTNLLPPPASHKQRFTPIEVPSMRRFVTDSGKLACLDRLLRQLKEGGHRVLLYFQMTRMIDLMEEYLTYRNYKYCRLDGSTKLEDRRDTVAAFQSSPEIFVFLLSTRAGGLGINLTSADTVIFYDSDWNPTIDSQAMDRAHRLGQTRQVTVYRLITRGTIEERIRKRALQKEEVQRVVITGQAGAGVDFTSHRTTDAGSRTKDIAMWLADDDQAEAIERREAELVEEEARAEKAGGNKTRKRKAPPAGAKRKEVSMDDMYHEGEGKFEDGQSHEPSGAATPISTGADGPPAKKRKGLSKKAKTVQQRLAVVDGEVG